MTSENRHPQEISTLGLLAASLNGALVLATIRQLGAIEAARSEAHLHRGTWSRRLARATRERLVTPRDCARFHAEHERAMGLEVHLHMVDEAQAWLIYSPAASNSAWEHVTAVAALPACVGRTRFRVRHAATAAAARTPVVFVQTHDVTEGDPFDAGYFAPADADDEHYRWCPGPLPRPNGGETRESTIPPSRSARYTRALARRRIVALFEFFGTSTAGAIVEHAFATLLVARHTWLLERSGVGAVTSPREAARLCGRVSTWLGEPAAIDVEKVTIGPVGRGVLPNEVATRLSQAIVSGWNAVLPLYGFNLRVASDCHVPAGGSGLRFYCVDNAGRAIHDQ